jgi:hypothetical protein
MLPGRAGLPRLEKFAKSAAFLPYLLNRLSRILMAFTVGGDLDHPQVDADNAFGKKRRLFQDGDGDGESDKK